MELTLLPNWVDVPTRTAEDEDWDCGCVAGELMLVVMDSEDDDVADDLDEAALAVELTQSQEPPRL